MSWFQIPKDMFRGHMDTMPQCIRAVLAGQESLRDIRHVVLMLQLISVYTNNYKLRQRINIINDYQYQGTPRCLLLHTVTALVGNCLSKYSVCNSYWHTSWTYKLFSEIVQYYTFNGETHWSELGSDVLLNHTMVIAQGLVLGLIKPANFQPEHYTISGKKFATHCSLFVFVDNVFNLLISSCYIH